MIKDVDGYDGKYQIDDLGNIYTVKRQGTDARILSKQINRNGYECVDLRNGSNKRKELVHRLVAFAFIPKPDGKDFINHKDGNKQNNNVSNLEWVTRSENMKHAYRNGLSTIPRLSGENHPQHKLCIDSVHEIKSLYSAGMSSGKLSKQYGVSKEQIMNIVKGKHWNKEVQK